MQLETYISDLLYRYDCIIVPEFGAFLTQRSSAFFNKDNHTFYPPKKTLSFNEQLQKNDGLMANYISEIEKIPYEVAVAKIAKKVKSIKSYLMEGETIHFKNIGEFLLNQEGRINFEPSNQVNYLTDSFGLVSVQTKDVNREVYKEEVESLEKTIPLTITPERKKARPYLKYAAVAIIALAMGGFAASSYYVGEVKTHNEMAQQKANEQLDDKVQQATFVIDNPLPAVTMSVEKQNGNYHIIAGAFRVEENSVKKVKQLREDGYKARMIGKNRYGLHEVVYGSYSDRVEALKALKDIKRNVNKDAWMLVKKLD